MNGIFLDCTRSYFSSTSSILQTKAKNDVQYGQPTPTSHPHILATGEIVLGTKLEEIQKRRINLLQLVQKHSVNHVDSSFKSHLVSIETD